MQKLTVPKCNGSLYSGTVRVVLNFKYRVIGGEVYRVLIITQAFRLCMTRRIRYTQSQPTIRQHFRLFDEMTSGRFPQILFFIVNPDVVSP